MVPDGGATPAMLGFPYLQGMCSPVGCSPSPWPTAGGLAWVGVPALTLSVTPGSFLLLLILLGPHRHMYTLYVDEHMNIDVRIETSWPRKAPATRSGRVTAALPTPAIPAVGCVSGSAAMGSTVVQLWGFWAAFLAQALFSLGPEHYGARVSVVVNGPCGGTRPPRFLEAGACGEGQHAQGWPCLWARSKT